MKGRKRQRLAIVTAGPTREYIDPVRYISNESSGMMGFAFAKALVKLGFKVWLITGPVNLPTPDGTRRIDVVTGQEMRRAVMRLVPRADLIVMAAAVSDWRPARMSGHKIKKRDQSISINLRPNPDILGEISKKKKPSQTVVGFALETSDMEKNARRKLAKKNCDWIVANDITSIGSKTSRVVLFNRNGRKIVIPKLAKDDLAVVILSHIFGGTK